MEMAYLQIYLKLPDESDRKSFIYVIMRLRNARETARLFTLHNVIISGKEHMRFTIPGQAGGHGGRQCSLESF